MTGFIILAIEVFMTTQAVTKERLDADLQYYINNKDDVAVIVYAIVKGNNAPLRMDIESPAQMD